MAEISFSTTRKRQYVLRKAGLQSSFFEDRARAAAVFDSSFYLRNYPDIKEANVDPLLHYLDQGWQEDRDPSSVFNTKSYLEANPDVKICPLVHYVNVGIFDNRPLRLPTPDLLRKHVAAAFDEIYYLRSNPDVAETRIDPLSHYLAQGWLEGRNPSSTFNTKKYIEENPSVAESGVCPLVHFVQQRITNDPLLGNPAKLLRETINSACSVTERVWPWLRREPAPVVDNDRFLAAIRAIDVSNIAGFAVSFSHDDYFVIPGGVENVVSDEETALRGLGWIYLHLCPSQPLPVLADETPAEDFLVSIRLNGELVGHISMKVLIGELGGISGKFRRVMILHHLLGFAPELIPELAGAFRPDETIAWVHDFFTLCSSYTLLRNNVTYCGAPDPDSGACGICAYGGDERKRHIGRMYALFDRLRPTVLAPSASAMQLWITRGSLPHAKAEVRPHGTLIMQAEPRPKRKRSPLRIGFAGSASYHKGWHVFRELAARYYNDPRYSFFHLGSRRSEFYDIIGFLHVSVNRDQRHLMVDALIENEIDVVINWSLCYETFSFTTFEGLAGGAFVVGRNMAGNIVPAITDPGVQQGIGLDTEAELFDLFESGRIINLANRSRFGTFTIQTAATEYLGRTQS